MLSRRAVFTLGLSRLVEGLDAASADPGPQPARPVAPAAPASAQRAWPRGEDAALWAPAAAALPRPAQGALLDLDEHDLDIASLPFEDEQFDAVVSAFGPMFSSDGRVAIDELFRVVRPGGSVAFTAWTPLGVVGRLLRLAAAHDPLPAGVPPPLAWGREERLRQELERHSENVCLERADLEWHMDSCERAVDRLIGALGPLAVAPRQTELRARAQEIVREVAEERAGGVVLQAGYVLARATRAPVLY